jgi:hypothetical protein
VFDATRQAEIEKILQIRHLYTHQNGIIDEKFRKSFPATKLNDEYQMTLDEFLDRFEYLAKAIEAVDVAYSGPSGPVIPLGVGRSFRCDVGRDWVAIWAAFVVSP